MPNTADSERARRTKSYQVSLSYICAEIDKSGGFHKHWRIYDVGCPSERICDYVFSRLRAKLERIEETGSWEMRRVTDTVLSIKVRKEQEADMLDAFSALDADIVLAILRANLSRSNPSAEYKKAFSRFHLLKHQAIFNRRIRSSRDKTPNFVCVSIFAGDNPVAFKNLTHEFTNYLSYLCIASTLNVSKQECFDLASPSVEVKEGGYRDVLLMMGLISERTLAALEKQLGQPATLSVATFTLPEKLLAELVGRTKQLT